MPEILLAFLFKKYHSACVLLDKFCVQLQDNSWQSPGISLRFSIGVAYAGTDTVGNVGNKTLMLSGFTHTQTTDYFARITAVVHQFSTLSTPTITTTTKYINK